MSPKQQGEEGIAEWVMSYADMITILMAFFVVMYSMAGDKDPPKQQAVMESLRNWLGPAHTGSPPGRYGSPGLRGGYPGMQSQMLSTDGSGEEPDQRGSPAAANWRPVQSLGGSVYFDHHATDLTAAQQEQLQRVANLLTGKRQLVEIHGLPGARWAAATAPDEQLDGLWATCRAVAERLVTLGIERQRLQIHVASSASEPQDRNLLREECDLRIDVNLSDRFLREP